MPLRRSCDRVGDCRKLNCCWVNFARKRGDDEDAGGSETLGMNELPSLTPKPASDDREGRYRLTWWALALALVAGGIMRFIWIEDMEWKHDEQWTYLMSQEVGRMRPWPSVGIRASLKFPNPGLSMWMFVPIGRIADRPTTMARVVACLNMIGLIGFVAAVRAYLPPREREPWLWGLAHASRQSVRHPDLEEDLAAVDLDALAAPALDRPSISPEPLGCLGLGIGRRPDRPGPPERLVCSGGTGTRHRDRGIPGPPAAITLLALLAAGQRPGLDRLVSWVRTLSQSPFSPPHEPFTDLVIHRIAANGYSIVAAVFCVFPYSFLGLGEETRNFLIGPVVQRIPTHIPELAGLSMGLAVAAGALVWLVRLVVAPACDGHCEGPRPMSASIGMGMRPHPQSRSPPSEPPRRTGFYLWSMLAIPIAFYLLTIQVYFYHYFFVFCPVLFVGIAAFLIPWHRALMGMVIAQTLMSMLYLDYIHAQGGVRRGEYGRTYTRQVNR